MAMNNSQPEGTSNNRGYNQIYRPKPPVYGDRIKKTTDPNFYKPLPPVKGSTKPMKPGTKIKTAPPVAKNPVNKKKAALGSMLGSLSSGASFRNQ
jgi:hypothetical protein